MKLMVYSHDAFGLGNIRRMVAICDYLLKAIPDLSVLVVSGSPALHQLRLPEGLDYIKLPCLSRNQQGQMEVRFLRTELEAALKLRAELIRTAAVHFQPDLLLVDKKPNGLWGELQLTIDYLKQQAPKTRMVLLLRDILDRPTVTIDQWQRENYYELTESQYDQVWIVGTSDIFDAPREYRFPVSLSAKTRFMGYIRRNNGLRHPSDVRQSLGISTQDCLVLVTPGGGADGFQLADTYLKAQTIMAAKQPTVSLIIGGPEMPADQKQNLMVRIHQAPNLHWLEFTDDLASYMTAADIVMSMGGYNTVGEILSLQKRAVVVPRTEPVEEQWIRARRMAELGLFRTIHPDELTPQRLAQDLQQELQQARLMQRNAAAGHPYSALGSTYQLDLNAMPRITEALQSLIKASRLPHNIAQVAV